MTLSMKPVKLELLQVVDDIVEILPRARADPNLNGGGFKMQIRDTTELTEDDCLFMLACLPYCPAREFWLKANRQRFGQPAMKRDAVTKAATAVWMELRLSEKTEWLRMAEEDKQRYARELAAWEAEQTVPGPSSSADVRMADVAELPDEAVNKLCNLFWCSVNVFAYA